MTHQFENAAAQEFADEQEYAKLLVEYYSRLETISPLLGKALTTGGALSKHIKNFVNPIDKELKIIETRMKIQHEDRWSLQSEEFIKYSRPIRLQLADSLLVKIRADLIACKSALEYTRMKGKSENGAGIFKFKSILKFIFKYILIYRKF